MRRLVCALATVMVLASGCSVLGSSSIAVGAIYPLSGAQGPGGLEEFRGARLAIDFVNEAGGIEGKSIDLTSIDVPGSDAVPGAISQLEDDGVELVLGSYGSTISAPAAALTSQKGMLFWESGAVGMFDPEGMNASSDGADELAFRVAPTGVVLGSTAIKFIAQRLAGKLGRSATSLRFGVASVDDVYGDTVARGALDALRSEKLTLAKQWRYDPRTFDADHIAKSIAAHRVDVLFVVAYLDDGVALRRAIVENDVDLVASIGTSSSYCHPEFGQRLGRAAVGLYASDKPDAGALDPTGLDEDAAALLARARAEYKRRYDEEMSAAALAGFSASWALFDDVVPSAASLSPEDVASAARSTALPKGSLPNGSGLMFGPSGSADAGNNLRAESVIWEWVDVRQRAVVWPPRYATSPIKPLAINS
jgi:branched-chain amino acid transport system substrate-binding protein